MTLQLQQANRIRSLVVNDTWDHKQKKMGGRRLPINGFFYSFYFSSFHPAVNKTRIVWCQLSLSPLATWHRKYRRLKKLENLKKIAMILV